MLLFSSLKIKVSLLLYVSFLLPFLNCRRIESLPYVPNKSPSLNISQQPVLKSRVHFGRECINLKIRTNFKMRKINVWYKVFFQKHLNTCQILRDNLPRISCFSACLASGGTGHHCSELPLQGCFHNKHPRKIGTVSTFRIKGRPIYCPVIIKIMAPSRVKIR